MYLYTTYVYYYEKIIRIFLFPIRLGMVISINCTFFELLKFTVHIVIVANLHQTELAIMQRTIFFCREKQQKGKKLWTNCVFIGPICAKRNSLGAILHESNQSLDAMLLHLKARSRLGTQSSSTLVLIVLKKDTLPHYLFWIMHPTVPSWVCYPKEMMCRSSF